ncbi:hypothetical protein [Cobetia sp. L2A1]|uniref:hypothetical protein n=1 Tax=Cobetia sp. L2A1 TaxID=2686360 RepID=UPI00131A841C|nr:hypothetical protein [Cobetia sp. L2A1]
MNQETKTEFVNRFMDVPFKSIQGKYSFCNETDKKVLFSLDVGGNEDNDVILSSDWSRNGYAHSVKHIDKIVSQGYDLFVFKVRTKCRVPDDQISQRSYPLLASCELIKQFIQERLHGHQAA